MMGSVILRYATPLASFGHTGRFDNRPTALTPTVSAVQGLLAAAAGIGRGVDWPRWLAELHLAVRVDRHGRLMTDYHTINQPPARRYRDLSLKDRGKVRVLVNAEGNKASFDNVQSRRSYVVDAEFVVALDDPTGAVSEALRAPRWALYAGRKSCPLTEPMLLGERPEAPQEAIAEVPTVVRGDAQGSEQVALDAIVFAEPEGATSTENRNDRALRFRDYRPQRRWHTSVSVPAVRSWFEVIDTLASSGADT